MAKNPVIVISGASVKVMRSYDYCHFEVNLSTATDTGLLPEFVDNMRKEAMRLTDKAVEQYKTARKVEDQKLRAKGGLSRLQRDVDWIEKNVPEDQRTPEQQAAIKAFQDYNFQAQFDYDYEDDWKDDDDAQEF